MKVGSLFCARGFLSNEAILYIYKSVIRPSMEYCSHIWAGAPAKYLSTLDKIQKRIVNLVDPELGSVFHTLSHRRTVASLSLFYKYFHQQCSRELSDLVPPLRNFRQDLRCAGESHGYTVALPRCKRCFYASSFFPRTSALWNDLPVSCFPDGYDLLTFKRRVNRHLLSS